MVKLVYELYERLPRLKFSVRPSFWDSTKKEYYWPQSESFDEIQILEKDLNARYGKPGHRPYFFKIARI